MTVQYTEAQKQAVIAVLQALLSAVRAAGANGVPAGEMYARLMPAGLTLDQFNQCMGTLVRLGKVYKHGHLYVYNQSNFNQQMVASLPAIAETTESFDEPEPDYD